MIIHKILINALLIAFILIISSFTASAGTVKIVTNIDPGDPDSAFEYKVNDEIVSITTKGGTGTVTVPLKGSGNNWEYELIQLPKENWQIDSARCDNGFHPPDIYVFNEQTVTCTFVNSLNKEDEANNEERTDDSSSPSPMVTNSEKKSGWEKFMDFMDGIFDYVSNSYLKKIVKNPTESLGKTFEDIKKDTDYKSGEPEGQKDAADVEIKVLGEGEMGYDDGELDKQYSIGDMGQAVFFSSNGELKIYAIKVFSARSGDDVRKFDIEIWDNDLNTLYTASYDYTDFYPDTHPLRMSNSDLKWVTINVPNIEVNGNFYISIFTYSRFDSGISIGGDLDTKSGNSFVVDKNPNRIVEWPTSWDLNQDSTDWMIRVLTN